jgi:two-component system, sensor histidine kinase YesM
MLNLFKKWNTLRNQLLFVYIFVTIIVLLIVSLLTINQVSSLLKKNAENQIQQVLIEANGRLESLYEQISLASKLVLTNSEVQRILTRLDDGKEVSFREKQQLMSHVNMITANSDGIFSFQLFSNEMQRVLPLDEDSLMNRIDNRWIEKAEQAKGSLVWIGEDPSDKNYFLAIRRVNLIEREYRNGGYLLISIYREHFQFVSEQLHQESFQYSILLNQENQPIVSNYKGDMRSILENDQTTLQLNQQDYIVGKKTSKITGWTILILTPINALTEGLSGIRSGIILSGIGGLIIFTICSFILSTIITRPILNLTQTMQRAVNGSLTLNPKVSSVNEINKLNSTYNQLVKETNHLIQMVYQKELLRSRSELQALQAQINPHFLFNTLDALRWSLEEKNEEELSELVIAMSNLFRYTITKESDPEWVFLKDAMKHIDNYMEIMKMRFGDRLHYHPSVPKDYEHVRLPKLIIQPFVENAIQHGVGNKLGDCLISISVNAIKKSGMDFIKISVRDNGPGMDREKLATIVESMETGGVTSINGNGIGISNVYKRIKLFYDDKVPADLFIFSKPSEGTTVSIEIPYSWE